jgi:hypothetical protein
VKGWLICGICQATLEKGDRGAGATVVVCDSCKKEVYAEYTKALAHPAQYLIRPRAA